MLLLKIFSYRISSFFSRRRAQKHMSQWTERDQKTLEFYTQFIKAGDICFDIGANIGQRTKIFLRLGARVIALEPQTQCIKWLTKFFGRNDKLTLIHKAVGALPGKAEIKICNADTISSLSEDWIAAVKKSGRFTKYDWYKKEEVQVTTLDNLIEQYGAPAFIKIDVEGYEPEVIRGLTRPVQVISLEFTPEFLESTFFCISHLAKLGEIKLNLSLGESMSLALDKWVSGPEMMEKLLEFKDNNMIFGDIYVKF